MSVIVSVVKDIITKTQKVVQLMFSYLQFPIIIFSFDLE